MKQNSKQSQNNKTKTKKIKIKSKKSVSDFHNSCNVKKEKETN